MRMTRYSGCGCGYEEITATTTDCTSLISTVETNKLDNHNKKRKKSEIKIYIYILILTFF
jgi:hypothetical protein